MSMHRSIELTALYGVAKMQTVTRCLGHEPVERDDVEMAVNLVDIIKPEAQPSQLWHCAILPVSSRIACTWWIRSSGRAKPLPCSPRHFRKCRQMYMLLTFLSIRRVQLARRIDTLLLTTSIQYHLQTVPPHPYLERPGRAQRLHCDVDEAAEPCCYYAQDSAEHTRCSH
jgi:hypothetical protein